MYDEIRVVDMPTWTAKDALIVDVRESWEFASGHLPGAVNIPLGEVVERIEELREPLVLVCATGARSGHVAEYLTTHAKFSRVANLLGGTNSWIQVGNPLEFPSERVSSAG